jgi:MoaA/NifB/PqqE/SkfB family radical SAM enzyme
MFFSSRRIISSLPRIPLSGSIDITYRCNHDCRHCWLVIPGSAEVRNSELSFAQWREIIDQARALGTREWSISGGEPMLRPDFSDILTYIKESSTVVSVFSNGTLITPAIAKLLKGCDVQISLYGATKDVYDHITRAPGSYEKMMAGIACLREHRVPFTIRAFPMNDNFHQWPQMLEMAQTLADTVRIGAAWLHLSATGDAVKNEEIRRQRLSPRQVIDVDPPNLCWEERYGQGENCHSEERGDKLFAECIATRNDFHVEPDGNMSFCLCVKDPSLRFNLRRHTFQHVWENLISAVADSFTGGNGYSRHCGSCDKRSDCRWCSVYSYLEHREHGKPIDYLCKIAAEKRKSDEVWRCDHRRYFEIADLSIQVDSDRPLGKREFVDQLDHFKRSAPGSDLIRLQHHYGLPKVTTKDLGTLIFNQAPWQVYKKENGFIYICYIGEPAEQRWLHLTTFNNEHNDGHVYNNPDFFMPGVTHNSLAHFITDQLWIAQLLSHRQGFYLHSTGLIMNGQGMLFVGHSEAGKSTTTRMLAAKATVLCDDRNIVRYRSDGWRVYGTWSHGEIPVVSDYQAPLRAIFFIEKSQENRIVPLAASDEKKRRLLPCVVRPVITADWWERTLPLVSRLAESVPCYIMYFDKSGDIVPQIEELMRSLPSGATDSGEQLLSIKTGLEQGVVVDAEY